MVQEVLTPGPEGGRRRDPGAAWVSGWLVRWMVEPVCWDGEQDWTTAFGGVCATCTWRLRRGKGLGMKEKLSITESNQYLDWSFLVSYSMSRSPSPYWLPLPRMTTAAHVLVSLHLPLVLRKTFPDLSAPKELTGEEHSEKIKWSHYSQAAKWLKSTRLKCEEMSLYLF